MTNWNYDISAAPRGYYVEDKLPGRGGSVRIVRRHVAPRVLLASTCGKVITSRWLPPDEREKRPIGRWEFFNADQQPLAWQPYPMHPQDEGNGT